MKEITGGCFCAAIRYRSTATPLYSVICYCPDCRKIVGAQSVAWITVPSESFCYIKGAPQQYQSSPKVVRDFCATCGTSLAYRNSKRPGEIDITTGSLDSAQDFPPRHVAYPSHKLQWDVIPGGESLQVLCD